MDDIILRITGRIPHDEDDEAWEVTKDVLSENPLLWRHFITWLKERTGDSFDHIDLESVKGKYGDYTLSGAKDEAEHDPEIAPYLTNEEEDIEDDPATEQLINDIETLRGAGYSDGRIVRLLEKKAGLNLNRPTSEGLREAQKMLAVEVERANAAERKLLEQPRTVYVDRPAPAAPVPIVVAPPPVKERPSQAQIEALYEDFSTAVQSRAGRPPRAAEYARFTSCVEGAESFEVARSECTRLVQTLVPERPIEPAVVRRRRNASLPSRPLAPKRPRTPVEETQDDEEEEEPPEYEEEDDEEDEDGSSFTLRVENLKTGKVKMVPFASKRLMDAYIGMLKGKDYRWSQTRR